MKSGADNQGYDESGQTDASLRENGETQESSSGDEGGEKAGRKRRRKRG